MIGDIHYEVHVVLDQDDDDPGRRDTPQQYADPFGARMRQTRRRLVQHQHPRPGRQCPGDLHQPLVDMGQSAGGLMDRPLVADEGEQALRRLVQRLVAAAPEQGRADGAEPAAPERHQQIVQHRHLREELGGLVGPSDAGPGHDMGRQTGQVPFAQQYPPGIRFCRIPP